MIKIIKIRDSIYQNIEAKTIDENGKEAWNIPNDLDQLKQVAKDTVNWYVGSKIKEAVEGNVTLLSASNSKAIVLLAKVLNTLSPDISGLSKKEQNIYNNILTLANNGYADSNLLDNMLSNIISNVTNVPTIVSKIENAATIDEIIDILNSL